MDNPGSIALLTQAGSDFQVGAGGTQVGAPLLGLAGMLAAALQVQMAGGAGGTKINVYIQTSLDQGQSFFDIANVAFANTPGVEMVNLSALDKLTTPTAPTNLALPDNTVLDGPLGDRLMVVVVSTGNYSGSTLVSVRGVVR